MLPLGVSFLGLPFVIFRIFWTFLPQWMAPKDQRKARAPWWGNDDCSTNGQKLFWQPRRLMTASLDNIHTSNNQHANNMLPANAALKKKDFFLFRAKRTRSPSLRSEDGCSKLGCQITEKPHRLEDTKRSFGYFERSELPKYFVRLAPHFVLKAYT